MKDPLYLAILKYHCGMSVFELVDEKYWDAAGGEDAVVEGTWGAPYKVLEQWTQPAQSRDAALEALKLIIKEVKNHMAPEIVGPMAKAALAYFEKEAA